MIELNAATLLAGWAAGGWFFLWVTTRRREVGLGYGWLMRAIFLALVAGSLVVDINAWQSESSGALDGVRVAGTVAFGLVGTVALIESVRRRAAGVAGQRAEFERRSARVAAMTGIERSAAARKAFDPTAAEFRPAGDLVAAATGFAAVTLGALAADGPATLALARTVVGALFIGAVTGTMLLGHWYLVQPGLPRAPLIQLVWASGIMWVPETVVLLVPTGMWSVLDGTIDDGYGGLLGWFWVGCVALTAGLVVVTRAALRERQYSAVMAATGLMYLAIVTAYGQDLVARILLTP